MERTIVVLTFVLILSAACNQTHRAATGFHLDLASAPEQCGDDSRWIVISALGNHRVAIGSADREPLAIRELAPRLREMFQFRAEKVAFVKAEPGVSFDDFVEVLDVTYPEADVTSMATSRIWTLAQKRFCLEVSCGRCSNFFDYTTRTRK